MKGWGAYRVPRLTGVRRCKLSRGRAGSGRNLSTSAPPKGCEIFRRETAKKMNHKFEEDKAHHPCQHTLSQRWRICVEEFSYTAISSFHNDVAATPIPPPHFTKRQMKCDNLFLLYSVLIKFHKIFNASCYISFKRKTTNQQQKYM